MQLADRSHSIAAWIVGLLFIAASLPELTLDRLDFRCFYESAEAWLHGGKVYSVAWRPNLNPPWLAMLMSPLTALPLLPAFLVWTAINLSLVWWMLRRIASAKALPFQTLVLLSLCTLPSWGAWRQGQVTWLLCACVTMAWLSPSRVRAGLWLAPAVMLKPPLALMALLLPWPIALVAGAVSFVGTAALIWLMGSQVWIEWLAMGHFVNWIGAPTNVSLWGHASRLITGLTDRVGMMHMSAPAVLGVCVFGLTLAWRARRANGDARWALAFLCALLMFPLGWLYYLPVAIGPMVASVTASRWLWFVAVVFIIPDRWLVAMGNSGGWSGVAMASMCGLAVLALWRSIDQPTVERSAP